MLTKNKLLLGFALSLILVHTSYAQSVEYGLIQQNPGNPLEFTAVVIPDFNAATAEIVATTFTFSVPEGTTVNPSVDPIQLASPGGMFPNLAEPGSNSFNWNVDLINESTYLFLMLNPALLQDREVHMASHLGTTINLTNLVAGNPIPLFSFTLNADCGMGFVLIETNGNPVINSILNDVGVNYNNSMDIGIGGGLAADRYSGNASGSTAYVCPLQSVVNAVDDSENVFPETATNIFLLANDNFGLNGPNTNVSTALSIVTGPTNGIIVRNDNGTPADASDDYYVYTGDSGYEGPDTFTYQICDNSGGPECDTAVVSLNVTSATAIPTMGQWALVLFGLTLLTIAVVGIYNFKIANTAKA